MDIVVAIVVDKEGSFFIIIGDPARFDNDERLCSTLPSRNCSVREYMLWAE